MKLFNTITDLIDASIIATTVITGGVSIAQVTSGACQPVDIVLNGIGLLFFLQQ